MGANCCVAARDKPLVAYQTRFEVSTRRNVRYSPSWSFRWDNRTHIEDIMDNPAHCSLQNSGIMESEIKSGTETETDGLSNGGSPVDVCRTPKWQKSTKRTGTPSHIKVVGADWSTDSNSSPVDENSVKLSGSTGASASKHSLSILSTPSSSARRTDPSSSRSRSLPCDPTSSSRKTCCSPSDQLSRQISDSKIATLKSLNENGSPVDRQSFLLSGCSNDLSNGGSQGGSSDGWSMRTFSELVASSQRERWSFGSENQSSTYSMLARQNSPQSFSLSGDLQTCGVCLKPLKDRSPWSFQKIAASSTLDVVAVLVCGHVYHAECLESATPENDRYDPSCPVCTHGQKYGPKLLAKAEKKAARSKISRIAVADVDRDGNPASERLERGNSLRLGATSSMKKALSRPFLRRHFSFGLQAPVFSVPESEFSTRKKGFWARYWSWFKSSFRSGSRFRNNQASKLVAT